jgi:hypothetical protein
VFRCTAHLEVIFKYSMIRAAIHVFHMNHLSFMAVFPENIFLSPSDYFGDFGFLHSLLFHSSVSLSFYQYRAVLITVL